MSEEIGQPSVRELSEAGLRRKIVQTFTISVTWYISNSVTKYDPQFQSILAAWLDTYIGKKRMVNNTLHRYTIQYIPYFL